MVAHLIPVEPEEVVEALREAIRRSSPGAVGREADCFLATLAASYLANSLDRAGLIVARLETNQDAPRLL